MSEVIDLELERVRKDCIESAEQLDKLGLYFADVLLDTVQAIRQMMVTGESDIDPAELLKLYNITSEAFGLFFKEQYLAGVRYAGNTDSDR